MNIIFVKNSKEETFVLDCFSKVSDYQCSTLEEEYFTVDILHGISQVFGTVKCLKFVIYVN